MSNRTLLDEIEEALEQSKDNPFDRDAWNFLAEFLNENAAPLLAVVRAAVLNHAQQASLDEHEDNGEGWCIACGIPWPCGSKRVEDTIRTLDPRLLGES